jgi:hypothetical protein
MLFFPFAQVSIQQGIAGFGTGSTIVFIFPLFALALLVRSWSHRKTATCIFMTGMLIYLSYAVYTLGLELMGPIIGNVYIPVILVTLIFGIYALNDKSKA